MEQDIEKENERLRDLLYSKIMFIEQLKKDYRNLVKDIEEIIKNYNEARDLAIELRDAHETVRKEFLRADKNKDMWREKAERLKEENDGLKSQLDFEIQRRAVAGDTTELLEDEYSELVRDYKKLREENERLKREFEIESLTDNTTGETIYRSNLINKYRMTLQEIKAIAEENKDTVQYGGICRSILMELTKAEEE